MTISSTVSEISYDGDDVSVSFPIPFVFDTSADLAVIQTDADGNPVVLSSGFSVAGGAGSTGTLTLDTALPSDETLTILDDPERNQSIDYIANDAFPAESAESGFDRGVRISKRLYQLVLKSMRVADGDPAAGDGMELGSVDNRKGKYLFFNAVTGAIEYAVSLVTTALSRSIIAQLLNPQTSEESSAGATPINYWYDPGHVLRYDDNSVPGTTDMIAAWTDAVNVASAMGIAATGPAGLYNISTDLALPSNTRLVGIGGRIIFVGAGDVTAEGTAAGDTSDFTADGARNDKVVAVVDGSLFSAGDTVEVLASVDEHDNSTKLRFAELNEVESVSVNDVTLVLPLAHPYTTGLGDEPSLTIVDSLIENITVERVEFQGGNFLQQYVDGLRMKDCAFSNQATFGIDLTAPAPWGSSRNVKVQATFKDEPTAGSGPFAHVNFFNVRQFELRAYTEGGFKDGLRLRGCADGDVWASVFEALNRDIWLYDCDNVDLWHPKMVGTQTETSNMEVLLFDFSRDCIAHSVHIDEANKKTVPDMVEFRQICENCWVLGGRIEIYASRPVSVKPEAIACGVRGVRFSVRAAGPLFLCEMVSGTPSAKLTGFTFDANIISNPQGSTDAITLFRTGSGITFADNSYDYLNITNNVFERGGGNLLLLSGAGTGTKIGIVRVAGNITLNGEAAAGSIAAVLGLPVSTLVVSDNFMDVPGTREIQSSSADNVYISNNNCDAYTITNQTILLIDGLGAESANAETPTAANWTAGQVVDFTDTGDASGDGLYMLMLDGATWQQMA